MNLKLDIIPVRYVLMFSFLTGLVLLWLLQVNSQNGFRLSSLDYSENSISISASNNTFQKVRLPHAFQTRRAPFKYTYAINAFWDGRHNGALKVLPMDCLRTLTVNDRPVDLKPYQTSLCDFRRGVVVELQPYLSPGNNHIYLEIEDLKMGGQGGISLMPIAYSSISHHAGIIIGVFLIIAPLWFALLLFYRIPRSWIALSLVALLLIVVRFFCTSIFDYAYDNPKHGTLIQHFARHWWPKPLGTHFLSYHPPLYYYLSAVIYRMTNFWSNQGLEYVRFLSIPAYLVFLLFGIRTIRLVNCSQIIQTILVGILIFWPVTDFSATRINNDILLYSLWAGAIYYFFKWQQDSSLGDLNKLLLCLALGIATKTNAYVVLISVLMSCALNQFFALDRSHFRTRIYSQLRSVWKGSWFFLLLVVLAVILASGRIFYHKFFHNPELALLVANSNNFTFTPELPLSIFPNLLTDLKAFFYPPFPLTSGDRSGYVHNYFVHLYKSILYAEGFRENAPLARVINLLGLLILSLASYRILFTRLAKEQYHYLLWILVAVGLHFSNYLNVPLICTADARYIYPVIIPVLMMIGSTVPVTSLEELRSHWYYPVITALLLLFATASFYLLLVQHLLK